MTNTSVVIAVFNEEKYIKTFLDSLMKQTLKPKEIIIVDNNCTDNTIAICKNYPVKIVKESRQGMIFARNRGFDEATGYIIAKCDADAVLPKNWIEKIDSALSNKDVDAMSGLTVFNDVLIKTRIFTLMYGAIMKVILKGNDTLQGPNMALKKAVWDKVKKEVCLDDRKVHEDIDLSIHIIRKGGKVWLDKNLIVYASGRRVKKNPFSFFIEYPYRLFKTLYYHRLRGL